MPLAGLGAREARRARDTRVGVVCIICCCFESFVELVDNLEVSVLEWYVE